MKLGLLLDELDRAGIDYLADYADTGFHSWHTFVPDFRPGWAPSSRACTDLTIGDT